MYTTPQLIMRAGYVTRSTTPKRIISSTYKPVFLLDKKYSEQNTVSLSEKLPTIFHLRQLFNTTNKDMRNEVSTHGKNKTTMKSVHNGLDLSKENEEKNEIVQTIAREKYIRNLTNVLINRVETKQIHPINSSEVQKNDTMIYGQGSFGSLRNQSHGVFLTTTASYSVKSVTFSPLSYSQIKENKSSFYITMKNIPNPSPMSIKKIHIND